LKQGGSSSWKRKGEERIGIEQLPSKHKSEVKLFRKGKSEYQSKVVGVRKTQFGGKRHVFEGKGGLSHGITELL